MAKVKAIPEGYGTVTPFLSVKETVKLIDFLKSAFGAEEVMRAVESLGLGAHSFLHGDESADICGSEFLTEKARASGQELAQDGRAIGSQIFEMRHKHGAKIEHFLPAQNIRADVQFAHYRLASHIVLIVKPSLSEKRA